jgi:hypothetical protein
MPIDKVVFKSFGYYSDHPNAQASGAHNGKQRVYNVVLVNRSVVECKIIA